MLRPVLLYTDGDGPMAHGSGARALWYRGGFLGVALLAACGCTPSKDKSDIGLRNLDPRTKAALIGPTGTPVTAAPKPKFQTTDPANTGADGITVKNSFDRKAPYTGVGGGGIADTNRTTSGAPSPTANASMMTPQKVADAPGYGGALPKPDITMVGATTVAEPLHNPIPPEMPAPIQPIIAGGAPPAPFPPPAPTPAGLPVAPVDSGYLPVPSVTEKPIDLPMAPLMIK